jgi:hypothetical protein
MGKADYYLSGAWNFICDQCGDKFKSPTARFQWDGLIVCPRCWDPRHPQDFIRPMPESVIPWSRPDMSPCTMPAVAVNPRFVDFPFPVGGTFVG